MDDRTNAAILKLKAEAPEIAFTGFITDAEFRSPAMLTGVIWAHVRADGSGIFADGHRIQTSDIVHIHVRGDSLWATTRSGSNYGVISFTPFGWTYFSDLCKSSARLDPQVPGSPIVHLPIVSEITPGLAKRKTTPISEPAPLSGTSKKRGLGRPEQEMDHKDQYAALIKEVTEMLERNRIKLDKTRND